MAEENTGVKEKENITDIEKCQGIIKQRDTIKRSRQSFEKQWLINIAFLHGKQYFQIEKSATSGLDEKIHWELKNLQRKKKTRRIDNYILPLYRSLLARMLNMKSHISVDATTNSDRDKSAAKVSQEALEDFWQMANKNNPILSQDYSGMILVLAQLFKYLLGIGIAYLKPVFNPRTQSKHFLNEKVDTNEIGEVETKVIHGFDVFKDPLKRYIIEQSVMSIDDVEEMYNKKVAAEDIGYTETEQKLLNLLEGSKPEKFEDAVRVFEKAQIPSKKHPNGRYQVCTSKIMLHEGDLPPEYKGRLLYFEFKYLDLMLSSFPQGMIEQLISLQEELNHTISELAAYKKWLKGKLMVPKNANLETKVDDEVGQIIYYNAQHKPDWSVPPSPPSFLMLEIRRIKAAMEDIAAAHDASMGRVPGGVKSGVGIEELKEADVSQLAPNLISIEQKLAFFAETVLDIMEAKYSEPRLLAVTGDLLGAEVKTFKGGDVKGNRRIKISLGSGLPHTKQARQTYIDNLVEKEYITKEKGRELLEFGDVEGVFHSLDETLQKEEIQHLLEEGYDVVVEEWDDHTIHIKVITDFMKSKQFFELPDEIRKKFIAHRQTHQQNLLREQEAQATMQMRAQMAAGPPGAGPGGQSGKP